MIPRLEGWAWEARADSITLAASAPAVGSIRYRERLRPLERLGDLLRHHAPVTERVSALQVLGEPSKLVTCEGEYGAFVELDAVVDGQEQRWALAFVFIDDAYACLEGSAPRGHGTYLANTVRRLALQDRHQLGVRRRRYLFRPPPWQALMIGNATAHYLPYEYPTDPSRIIVYPAIPFPASFVPTIDLQRTLGEDIAVTKAGPPSGFVVIDRVPSVSLSVPSGLPGTRWRFSGHWRDGLPLLRDIVLLRDSRYAYSLELVTDAVHAAVACSHFEAVFASIEPIPVSDDARSNVRDMLSYWSE